ncbi:MAG: hypothetical protein LKG27_07490 [Clostridiaceae bacterium]|nr:hypothetical protein [Clostridiaceae bacterium]
MYYYEQSRLTDNINKLAQYTTGATVLSQDDLAQQAQFFGLMAGGMGLYGAGKGGYWLYKNRKDVSGAWDAYKNGSAAKNLDFKNMQGKNIFESFGNISRNQYLDKIANSNFGTFKTLTPDEVAKLSADGKIRYNSKLKLAKQKEATYKDLKRLIEDAKKKTGKAQKEALKEIKQKMAKANLDIFDFKMARDSKVLKNIVKSTHFQKVMAGLRKYSGYNSIKGFKLAAEAGKYGKFAKLAKFAKFGKGNALFIALSAIGEAGDVSYAFKHGVGGKQLAYSTGSIAANIAGFAVGAQAGGILGAEVGGAIGTIVPGIGNIIGAGVGWLIGTACGIAGGYLADKAYKGVVGKSPAELKKEEIAAQASYNATTSAEGGAELISAFEQKIQNEGTNDEETKQALEAYSAVVDAMGIQNKFQATA